MVRSNENMFGYTVLFSGSAEVEKLIILLLVYLWNFFQIIDALHTMLIFRTAAIGYFMSLIHLHRYDDYIKSEFHCISFLIQRPICRNIE